MLDFTKAGPVVSRSTFTLNNGRPVDGRRRSDLPVGEVSGGLEDDEVCTK